MENNIKSKASALFSYIDHPEIRFETHEPGEKIILMVRAHPFTQIYWVINSFFLLILLISVNIVVGSFFSLSQVFLINCFGIVIILSYIWMSFLNWYFNVGIVTNKRVVDIDFSSILYKEITVAKLDRIEDITIKSGGYFESFFDFGTVYIQTAGSEANIEFTNVSYPSEVVQNINKLLSRRHGI